MGKIIYLRLTEARCGGYGDMPLPSTRRWSIDRYGAEFKPGYDDELDRPLEIRAVATVA